MAEDFGPAYERQMIILAGLGRGLSGNAIIREVQAAGLGLRLTTLRAMIQESRGYYAGSIDAATADLNSPYDPPKSTKWPSRTQTGIGYVVKVAYRDMGTGQIGTLHYTTISDTPITPMAAINEAMNLPPDYFGGAERTVIGAVMTNAFHYTPMEL